MLHRFGSIGNAKEGLRAETTSFMVGDQPGEHAAYVKSYVQVLKEDLKEILCASRIADKSIACVIDAENEPAPTNIEKLPQIARPGLRM